MFPGDLSPGAPKARPGARIRTADRRTTADPSLRRAGWRWLATGTRRWPFIAAPPYRMV